MKLNLRIKLASAVAGLVLAVVGLVSVVYLATLTRRVIRQARDRAAFVGEEVFLEAQQALTTAARQGSRPASGSVADVNRFVQQAIETDLGWNAAVQGALGYSPSIYEITVSNAEGVTLVSSDPHLAGEPVAKRRDVDSLIHAGFAAQIGALYGPPQVYEFKLPFDLGGQPFGDVRVALSTGLLRNEISPGLKAAGWFALGAVLLSTLAAAGLSSAVLAPIQTISAQLDRIRAGESDIAPVERADEFGQVSSKISQIGRELRDVREVFSTLRHNLDQIMSQLEDGLLLVNITGRIVLASPSASQFLGMRTEELTGRMVSEVFQADHPLRQLFHDNGTVAAGSEMTEALLAGPNGPRRTGIRVQSVSEGGSRTGSLVTLTDLESRERIGSELEVSEHLASIGRVTAGVAHEVKNPLNSMRVWLEVLKSNLPVEGESQQATRMLDSEIERLDRVVKTFLDFTRPVEIQIEDVDMGALVGDVMEGARPEVERLGTEAVVKLQTGALLVRADRQLLRQAILNLVLNACQAMPNGGTLTVELAQDGDNAKIVISDTGVGIAPENRKRIFQLYFTTRPGGNGVGLANTLHFVQLHGGSIDFESEAGRGTRFTIRLPIARAVERRKHSATAFTTARIITTPRP
jgi:PAS domain S-box-containing protein